MAIEKRQKAILIAGGAALLASLVVGLAGGMFVRSGPSQLPMGLVVAICAALVGAALLASLPWWRRLDDMARDAHLTSWYWGATFGGGVAMLTLAALGGVGSPLFLGAILVFGAEVAAYVVCWLAWWALRRPKAS
jgi:hypothetical protein